MVGGKYEQAQAMLGDSCAFYIPLGEFFMFLPVLFIAAPDRFGVTPHRRRREVHRLDRQRLCPGWPHVEFRR